MVVHPPILRICFGVDGALETEDKTGMAIGPMQIAVILVVVVLLFGGKRFAQLGKGLGEGIRNFKRGVAGDDEQEEPTAGRS